MQVLEGILRDSKKYYEDLKKSLEKKISELPKGTIKKRLINGNKYYYLQYRSGNKVIQKYIGKDIPPQILQAIKKRKIFLLEHKKVVKALKTLHKTTKVISD